MENVHLSADCEAQRHSGVNLSVVIPICEERE